MTPERRAELRQVIKHFDESHAIDPKIVELSREALAAADKRPRPFRFTARVEDWRSSSGYSAGGKTVVNAEWVAAIRPFEPSRGCDKHSDILLHDGTRLPLWEDVETVQRRLWHE